jgi:DHA1 family bicyclomycin/chloramphenicol resistance-like MFS transporter
MTSTAPKVRFLDRTTPPHVITLVLMAGLSAMSMNIFLPSLPSMTVYFDTEPWLVALAVPVYLAVNALLQLVIGPVSDRFGRRPVLIWSTLAFLIATMGCLMAPSIEVFLIFRMAQAAIIAALVLSRAVVRDMYSAAESASMIGYVTMGMALVPMIAPAIGGILDETFGWKANFWFLFLSGIAVLGLIWTDLGETAKNRSTSFAEQFREYPELLTARRFWGYCATAAFASGAFFAYLGGAPFVATDFYGLSPAEMGAYFGFPALGYAIGNFCTGRYSVRFGLNRMVLAGTILTLVGMVLLTVLHALGLHHPLVFFGFFIFVGLGNGLVLPNATSGMLSVRPHLAGTASGLGGAMMIGGGAALSTLSSALLSPGSGPMPILWVMLATSAASVASILYVIRRDRQLGLA